MGPQSPERHGHGSVSGDEFQLVTEVLDGVEVGVAARNWGTIWFMELDLHYSLKAAGHCIVCNLPPEIHDPL